MHDLWDRDEINKCAESKAANKSSEIGIMLSRPFTLILPLLLAADISVAATLLNYEHRVVRAAEQIERIKADKAYDEEGISYIKRLLPRSEQIEFEGRETPADNTWLHVVLDSYTAQKDPQQRAALLNEAVGRLRALDAHLRRAEAEASGQVGDPRDKIRDILSRPAFQPEQETAVGAFVKRILRKVRGFVGEIYAALTRLLERLFGAGSGGGWISNLVLIVVLAAAVIVGLRFAANLRRPQTRRKKTRLVLGDEVAADATSRELADAGLAAARAGDFRTAVRKLYVSLLYELSERNLIELEDSATNREYLRKASGLSGLAAPMGYLTERFDYVWYGMFPSSGDDFATYLVRYEEAMERARSLGEQPAGA